MALENPMVWTSSNWSNLGWTLNWTWGSVQEIFWTSNWTWGSVLDGSGLNWSSELNFSTTKKITKRASSLDCWIARPPLWSASTFVAGNPTVQTIFTFGKLIPSGNFYQRANILLEGLTTDCPEVATRIQQFPSSVVKASLCACEILLRHSTMVVHNNSFPL